MQNRILISELGFDDLTEFFLNFRKVAAKLRQLDVTGKSLSEALIFASTKPQYDDRLLIELQVQNMKILRSNLGTTRVSTKMHTTVSCATRHCRVPHNKHCTKKLCRVAHDKFHDIIFPNEKCVVCHTTRSSSATRHILLLLWKIKYLRRVHFSILN